MSYRALQISRADKELLRKKFLETDEIVPISADPKFFSLIVSLGIHQEIGTIHDELSTFLFDARSGQKIPREKLRSEMVEYRGYSGVRVWAEGVDSLDLRVQGLRTLLHPEFSYSKDGRIYQCVFFPEIITQIAALAGAELVSVRPWGMNTVFGGFDPAKSYYEGSVWELVNVDALRYARLLENKQIVFWGTHDLVSHIAGIKKTAWPSLQARGHEARVLLEKYFAGVRKPPPFTLVLPYAMGILMDDLAQPMNYESESRKHVVELLMHALDSRQIDPESNAFLLRFPPSYEKLIALARADDFAETQMRAAALLSDLIRELQASAVVDACA